ncbi:hypothetical protein SISSUDRAFT_1043343 [Sistotremastrum suecicum HHB10207 ss-3]|uniref:Uncharacterized protein n=1 Tax=Sistotremastrum suecicum HHB10207 ss-3 TaxID=1314776 RepID=A0A166FVL7_9AGAM|nr:hypothetical protein SISSUDRAFT_1043343 [Sistotremastrum suecicum HHB10207 ss-3]
MELQISNAIEINLHQRSRQFSSPEDSGVRTSTYTELQLQQQTRGQEEKIYAQLSMQAVLHRNQMHILSNITAF